MYKDVELNAASDIAYYDLSDRFDAMQDGSGTTEPVPLLDLLSDGNGNVSNSDQVKIDNLGVLGVSKEELATWKVVDIYDTNDATGFYAVIIETSPGNAIVAFRGSEAFENLDDIVNDWFHGDFELLNSTLTSQHAEVLKFIESKQDILNQYNIASTGHSLGGNLSDYFTIVSGRYGLDDNIIQSVSNDGPGFSDEFLAAYKDEIQKMSGKMHHYSWSLVGELLQPLPGVDRDFIDVKNNSFYEYDKKTGKIVYKYSEYGAVTRHDRYYVNYDPETGMFIRGEQDELSAFVSLLSKGIDHMPKILGDVLLVTTEAMIISAMWLKDVVVDKDGNLTPAGWALLLTGVQAVIISPMLIPAAVNLAIPLALSLVITLAEIVIYEKLYEFSMYMVNIACDMVQAIYNFTKDAIIWIKDTVISIIEGIADWFKKNFDAGYKYSQSHTTIVIDTGKMYSYADQMRNVSRRLYNLNQRIDKLLWKLGPVANIIGLQSVYYEVGRLNRCSSYLSDTAREFDAADNDIAGKI